VSKLPVEDLRPRPHLRDTWRLRISPERRAASNAHGGPDGTRGGPGPVCGGLDLQLQTLRISTSGTRGDTGPIPEREVGPGPLARLGGSGPLGPSAQLLRA